MTRADQVHAVAGLGFTERQARFLVTVALLSGVCVGRQYCMFSGIVRGQKLHDFLAALVKQRLATAYRSAHRRACFYHLHGKTLYAAVGEPNNRNRRPATLARAVERLMVFDAVLENPGLQWLGAEREKVQFFESSTTLRPNELPHLAFGSVPRQTLRFFPDKLPIGVSADGRTHLFLYLIDRPAPVDFRAFLHRHVELFRALPTWEVRLLVPLRFSKSAPVFQAAAREELATPLQLDAVDELGWLFRQQREREEGAIAADERRVERARRQFHAPRFRTLYRLWKKNGDRLLHGTVSPVLGDALERGRGRVTTQPVARGYGHLASLVGSA